MRKLLIALAGAFLVTVHAGCTQHAGSTPKVSGNKSETAKNEIVYLTKQTFLEQIFNYEKESDWKYNGELPAIVDFYADWCGPCRMLSPVLEELQKEYGGKLQIYKVDTQVERQLAGALGIQSLPTVLFIPKDGKPQAMLGFRPKEDIEKIITDFLKVQK